jgi:hypothetical protein
VNPLVLVVMLGCGRKANPTPPAGADAGVEAVEAVEAPSADMDIVYRALLARDPEPECAAVEALVATPVPVLIEVVEKASQPPWVGMRAASCLATGHAGEAEVRAQLATWIASAEWRGLAIQLVGQFDAMPEDAALEIAQAGMAGANAADLKKRAETVKSEAVRGVLAGGD